MYRHLLCAAMCICAGGAIAQPGQNGGPGSDRQAAREQRRAELRTALLANRQLDAQNAGGFETVPTGRHLSPRELAEMRQQLRQQQAQSQHYRP